MKKKVILTIGREYGAEGHEIARMLADRLGIELFDKDLLYKIAERSGLEVAALAAADEQKANRWLQPYLAFGYSYGNLNDKLFQMQSQLIRELADKGSCIIVGRLGDYILKDYPECMKAFIYAPFDARVEIVKNKHSYTEEQARKLVKHMDTMRENYYRYYSNGKWNEKEGKDILLNRATFGVVGCVDILQAMMKEKMA